METLKDIFVPYGIAQKLKEIGFDEPCIAYFNSTSIMPDYPYMYVEDYGKNSTENKNFTTAPTYEQVFKWFRKRGIFGNLITGQFSTIIEIRVVPEFIKFKKIYDDENHYETAREQLVLKLIDIYR